MKKIIIILAVVFTGLTLMVIVSGYVFSWNTPYYARQGAITNENIPDPPEGATEESMLAELTGVIEGSLNYPSEFIPPLEVCAENIKTGEEFCTYEAIEDDKYLYGFGYKIEAPAGDYQVFARLQNPEDGAGDLKDYKAYYSDFVTCGLEYDCSSHNPLTVEVKAGETVSGIDPHDWYNQPAGSEPSV